MRFSHKEKSALLDINGVGPTVVRRFEEVGISSFETLASCNAEEVAEMVADMLGSTCWKNSPRALAAVGAAIERAKAGIE